MGLESPRPGALPNGTPSDNSMLFKEPSAAHSVRPGEPYPLYSSMGCPLCTALGSLNSILLPLGVSLGCALGLRMRIPSLGYSLGSSGVLGNSLGYSLGCYQPSELPSEKNLVNRLVGHPVHDLLRTLPTHH